MLEPQAVQVELYAEPVDEHLECRQQMMRLAPSEGARMSLYVADVPATRAAGDYTARIVPTYPGLNLPLEAPHVLWQR